MKKPSSHNLSIPIILITLIAFGACEKNDLSISHPIPRPDPAVTASVAGLVTDLNNIPIGNATISAGSSSTTTDVNGSFVIKDVQLSKDSGFVKVTKPGYFNGSRTFLVNAHTTNNVRIKLIPKTVSGTFDAASGGNIDVPGGGSVKFNTSAVVNATSGTAYTGNVSVSAFYLNPADPNFKDYMPGNLMGSSNNQENVLQSFGMISIEMDDAAGEKLQIANNKTATLTLPIPSSMQANAPGTIPLWYFDETKGFWTQEGSATKQGTNYVGTVAHFSFWTVGQLASSIRLDATFKVDTSSDMALSNKLVTITSGNYGTTNGYTDNNGTVTGLVPANETLLMKVFDDCGDSIYMQNIGPFTVDASLGIIKISGNNLFFSLSTITITGTAVDCNNTPVINGSVQIISGASHFDSPINNGNFSMTFSRCSNLSAPISLIAYDASSGLSSKLQTLNVGSGVLNTVQISVCEPTTTTANFFYYVSGSGAGPFTATFTNTSTNAASYVWDFGDGSTSTLADPAHVYTTKGTYTVTLTATGSSGSNSITKIIAVPDESFINLTMNGTTYSWVYPDSATGSHVDSTGGVNSTLVQGQNSNSIYFYIFNDNASPGTYNGTLSTAINNKSYPGNFITTTVTEYGAIGEYISGTASGQLREMDSTTNIPFTLEYKVRRIQ